MRALAPGDVVMASGREGVVLARSATGPLRVAIDGRAVQVAVADVSRIRDRARRRLDSGEAPELGDLKSLQLGDRVMFTRSFGIAGFRPHPLDESWSGAVAGENATVVEISERQLVVT